MNFFIMWCFVVVFQKKNGAVLNAKMAHDVISVSND